MTNANTLALLDQAELMQLALNASTGDDSGAAIAYLKETVGRADATAFAHYLLGAEYAQIGLYERAIGQMEAAIAQDPALSVARLQLGMLWLGANQAARALDVLAVLQELGEQDPLRHFGAGLIALTQEDKGAALQALAQGVALNTVNPALNGDMQRIMRQLEEGAAPAAPAAADDSQHVLLSAYSRVH